MKRAIIFVFISLIACEKDPIKYSLTITPSPSTGGFVNPTQGVYNAGENVQILASASQNYRFTRWSGSYSGTAPIATITMDSDKIIVGNFEDIDIDRDGVLNAQDLCGSTAAGQPVDSNGCSDYQKDTDGDGVVDSIDQCENTSPTASIVSSTGCEVDVLSFAANGVTIIADPLAPTGSSQEFNGETYTIVDNQMLRNMANNDEDVSNVVTTRVTSMYALFHKDSGNPSFTAESVNGDISHWDVSNVTDMGFMFKNSSFNGDISNWDVSSVTNMYQMFTESSFNKDIGDWDTSKVTNMGYMFFNSPFNKPIENWDVSSVTSMEYMFYNSSFNKYN